MQATYEFILIRYGELSLKGKNRKDFERRLQQNIQHKLRSYAVRVRRTHGRMYVHIDDADVDLVLEELKQIPGISSLSPARKAPLDMEAIKETALHDMEQLQPKPKTFKVNVRRANKSFAYTSQQMNGEIGGHILRNTEHVAVDLHRPETELIVEVRQEGAYIMSRKIAGAGGLPIGSSGKAMVLLSGGIDSPVASYLAMKRGLRIECVHFHSFPFTSERSKEKVKSLAERLSAISGEMILHVVPFTDIQTVIRDTIPEEYGITVMRRLMVQIVERLAKKRNALAMVTGDSLGQVASQTLESMHTINEVTNYPVLRPLVAMDKVEIIEIARRIGTYETSILPYEDCCTIFQAQSPKTKPKREDVHKLEAKMPNMHEYMEEAIERSERIHFVPSADSVATSDDDPMDDLL